MKSVSTESPDVSMAMSPGKPALGKPSLEAGFETTHLPSSISRRARVRIFSRLRHGPQRDDLAHSLEGKSREEQRLAVDQFYREEARLLRKLNGSANPSLTSADFERRYLESGIDFERTPLRSYAQSNEYIDHLAKKTEKTPEQIHAEIDAWAARQHESLRRQEGFLSRESSPEIEKIYRIFDKLVPGYNRLAEWRRLASYGGKLFVVDSANNNAFVVAEHEDVYLYSGIVRELAVYCGQRNLPFSEEVVAAILAHELGHVLQNSGHQGLDLAEILAENANRAELTQLKRAAELDADRAALAILEMAGYSPSQVTVVLEYLKETTPDSTAEHSFSTHPHPKQRLAELDRYLSDAGTVTSTWREALHQLPGERYASLESENHIAHLAVMGLSVEEIMTQVLRAKSTRQVFELGVLLDERVKHVQTAIISELPEARRAFARHVLAENLVLMAETLVARATKNPPETPRGANEGMYIGNQVSCDEFNNWPEATSSVEAIRVAFEQDSDELTEAELRKDLLKVVKTIRTSAIDPDVRQRLLKQIGELFSCYKEFCDSHSLPREPERGDMVEFQELAALYEGGDSAALFALARDPYGVYARFGLDHYYRDYDIGANAKSLVSGLDIDPSAMRGRLQREDAALYRENSASLQLETKRARAQAYNACLCEWVAQVIWLKADTVSFDSRFEFSAALDAVLPDLDGDTNDPDYQTDNAEWKDEVASNIDACLSRGPEKESFRESRRRLYDCAVLPLPQTLRSPTFDAELEMALFSPDAMNTGGATGRLLEALNDPAGAAFNLEYLLKRSVFRELSLEAASREERTQAVRAARRIISRELSIYSRAFRKEILEQLSGSTIKEYLSPQDFFGLCRRETGFASAVALTEKFLHGYPSPSHRDDRQLLLENIEFLNWYFERRDTGARMLPAEIGHLYLATNLEIMRRDGAQVTPEDTYQILRRLSRVVLLDVEWPSKLTIKSDDNLLSGEISRESYSRAPKPWVLQPEEIPIAFFAPPGATPSLRTGEPHPHPERASIEQDFFRQMMGCSRAQLQEIVRNQKDLLHDAPNSPLRRLKGKDRFQMSGLEFLPLLDAVIIRRTIEEVVPRAATRPVSPAYFAGLIEAKITEGESRSRTPELEIYEKTPRELGSELHAAKPGIEELKAVFAALSEGFHPIECVSRNTDDFFSNCVRVPEQIHLFPAYAGLLTDSKLAHVTRDVQQLSPDGKRISYLEFLAQRVDVSGLKARRFAEYLHHHPELLSIQKAKAADFSASRVLLERYLPTRSLHRDGYLDYLERQVAPELHRFSKADFSGFPFSTTGEINELFWRSLVEVPLQWQNLGSLNPEAWRSARREQALRFYSEFIPLAADPQRKTRMGCSALKIWRAHNKESDFRGEFAAVVAFLPDSSAVRDGELNELLNRHKIGGRGVSAEEVREVRQALSSYQGLRYDRELTAATAAVETVRAIMSAATPTDRKDFVLWILDKKKYPLPAPLVELENKANVDFDLLPEHTRFAPAAMRRAFFDDVFTGENGLLNCRTEEDREVRRELARALFDHYFPLSDNNPRKTGLEPEHVRLIGKLFVVVIENYGAGRASAILQKLIDLEFDGRGRRLNQVPFGERLATVLCSLGPAGKKLSQTLSEKPEIIKSPSLRKDFAGAKSQAARFGMIGALDAMNAAKFDLNEIEIGPAIAAASMGQVHRGAFRSREGWEPVVTKILRPDLIRTTAEDMRVLGAAVAYLKERTGKDYGSLAETVGTVIERESDFSIEARNLKVMRESLKAFSRETGLEVRVPELYSSENEASSGVLVEEEVAGNTIDHLRGGEFRQARETLRTLFLWQLLKDGHFHADLHGANAMRGAALHLIDMGLIGELTTGQRAAVNQIAKGIILHDRRLLAGGLADFLEISTTSPALEAGVSAVVKKRGLTPALQELGTTVLSLSCDPNRRDQLSTLIKGLCNTTWLFPLNLRAATGTFAATSNALDLGMWEKVRAIATNADCVLRETVDAVRETTVDRVILWREAVKEQFARVANLWTQYRSARKAEAAIQSGVESLAHIAEQLSRNSRREETAAKPALQQKVGSVDFDQKLNIKWDSEALQSVANAYLSRGGSVAELKKQGMLLAYYDAILERRAKRLPALSTRDAGHLTSIGSLERGGRLTCRDLIAAGLTEIMMKRLYPNAEERIVVFKTPQLRSLCRRYTRLFLAGLDREEQLRPPPPDKVRVLSRKMLFDEKRLARRYRHDYYAMFMPDVYLPAAGHAPVRPLSKDGMTTRAAGLAGNLELRRQLANSDCYAPGVAVTAKTPELTLAGIASRRGYNNGGLISLELHDLENGLCVKTELTDKEYQQYLKSGTLKRFEVEQFVS